jgi:superfamily II DNA or RNA helicase
MEAQTLSERREARRMSMEDRVRECAKRVNGEAAEPWVVWCDLNDESTALTAAIDGAIEIRGSDDVDTKEARLQAFASGQARVLVSKPSICGWGLNWQHAARMAFVGVTDSYEAYYQAVRRCWRFGQKRDVHVHIFSSKAEGAVVANLKRKEREAAHMAESLSAETRDAVMSEVTGTTRQTNAHKADRAVNVPSFLRAA